MLEKKRKIAPGREAVVSEDVKLWRKWLDNAARLTGRDNIAAITDPMAVPALAAAMKKDDSAAARVLDIEPLSNINSPMAPRCWPSLPSKTRTRKCGELPGMPAEDQEPGGRLHFISRLRDKNNDMVRRAGVALSFMKDPAPSARSIDALVTTHEYKITTGNPGGTSTSFARGPGGNSGMGMSAGGSTKIVQKQIPNQEVLDALVTLTKQNFGFDVGTWRPGTTAEGSPKRRQACRAIDAAARGFLFRSLAAWPLPLRP